jgi:predicted DsbA family dithiol-disulfide isomerase
VWLDSVKQVYGHSLDVNWKNYVLEQTNSKEEDAPKVWEKADPHEARALLALMAGEAARRQGREAFDKFHLALLKARHGGEERIPLNEDEPLIKLAGEAGLDAAQFREDLKDPSIIDQIGNDHTEGVEEHGVFGTPTFVFENGNAVYLKTFVPPAEDSVAFFEHFAGLMRDRPYLGELKRPQPPWPKRAIRD